MLRHYSSVAQLPLKQGKEYPWASKASTCKSQPNFQAFEKYIVDTVAKELPQVQIKHTMWYHTYTVLYLENFLDALEIIKKNHFIT